MSFSYPSEATLAEVPEAEADGETAAIYETIRQDTGSCLVNYIWRHLATLPGALSWCWELTRTNPGGDLARHITGKADAEAAAYEASATQEGFTLSIAARNIISVYNANNAANLARVVVLCKALANPDHEGDQISTSTEEALVERRAIPSIPNFYELDACDRESVRRLAKLGHGNKTGIIPSLWRHLAVEPGLLQRNERSARVMLSSKAFIEGSERLRAMAMLEADRRTIAIPVEPAPGLDRIRLYESLSRFSLMIADMTLAGRIMLLK